MNQTSEEAFEAYFSGSHRAAEQGFVRDVAQEAWDAAVNWMRMQHRSVHCIATAGDECAYARAHRMLGDPRVSVGMSAENPFATLVPPQE